MDFKLSKEQLALKERAHNLVENEFKPHVVEWEEKRDIPARDILKKLAANGFTGMLIPKELGGQGKTLLDAAIVHEELAKACIAIPLLLMLTSVGALTYVSKKGTDKLKTKYLGPIARGEKYCGLAISEPEVGSAMTDMQASAELKGDYYVINGTKAWTVINADVYMLYARFGNAPGAKGIGILFADGNTPGLSYIREAMMGYDTVPRGRLVFKDCKIPKENLIVKPNDLGDAMRYFNCGRVLNAASSVGTAQAAYEESLKYAAARKQFGRPISEFQAIQFLLVDMYTKIEAARFLVYKGAMNVEDGVVANPLDTSVAKLYANEVAIQVCDAALQVHGAKGYLRYHPIERMYRDCRGTAFGEGTVQIQRLRIASELLGRKVSQRKD